MENSLKVDTVQFILRREVNNSFDKSGSVVGAADSGRVVDGSCPPSDGQKSVNTLKIGTCKKSWFSGNGTMKCNCFFAYIFVGFTNKSG